MRLERIYTPGLAQVAYLVGDEQTGVAAVIDPRRDVDEYLALADAAGLRITHVCETHIHADFVSGALELARASGATIYASRVGESAFAHEPLDDGDVLEIGALRLQALWTPGHTPEHMSYLLFDPARGHQPVALFSGDLLFVGEVGRPDLLGEGLTDQLAGQLYESIHQRLMSLPDDLVVYPGHGAGSSCGKSIGDADSTTMGQEKRFNYAFQTREPEAFRRAVLENMPPAPTYYPVLKRVNKAGARPLAELTPGTALSVQDVERRIAGNALLIDTRSPAAFGGAHIPGALFAGLGTNFTTWMGWLAPYDRDLVLLLEEDWQFEEARTQLRRIGLDRVAGYLAGGLPDWLAAGRDIASLPQLSVHELHERLAGGLHVLDVRGDDEWRGGHIADASHRYAGELVRGANGASVKGVPTASPLALICGSGYRSSVVASVLQRQGRADLLNVLGGMEGWQAAGFETVRE
jgi:hydroxyacylglutathione hydrolase